MYKDKITKAIHLAETLEDIEYIEEKIRTSPQINRRTNEGKELVEKLLILSNQKAQQLIKEGALPF